MGKKIMVSESCVQGKFFFGKATRHQPQNNRRREAVSMHRKKTGGRSSRSRTTRRGEENVNGTLVPPLPPQLLDARLVSRGRANTGV